MQGLMRLACLFYLILLTTLLLAANPWRFVFVHGEALGILHSLDPFAHFLSFGVLATLAFGTRWPAPRWAVFLFLGVYAGATELLQWLMPPRAAEWSDWLRDLAGIGTAAGLCWGATVLADLARRVRRSGAHVRQPLEEWEVLQSVLSRTTARDQSWWA
ncbi:MAG: VanZ family protein [Thermoguttaceae bacterium]